ncbi:hypothetical protein ABTE37_19605, partial [Acinetobacter baumannii]
MPETVARGAGDPFEGVAQICAETPLGGASKMRSHRTAHAANRVCVRRLEQCFHGRGDGQQLPVLQARRDDLQAER